MIGNSNSKYIVSAGNSLLPAALLDVVVSFFLIGKQYPPYIPVYGVVMALLSLFLRRSNLAVAFNLAHWLLIFIFFWLPIVLLAPYTLFPALDRAQIHMQPYQYFMVGAYSLVLFGSWLTCLWFLLKANLPEMRKARGLRCTPISHSVYAGLLVGCAMAMLAILKPNSVAISSPYSQGAETPREFGDK